MPPSQPLGHTPNSRRTGSQGLRTAPTLGADDGSLPNARAPTPNLSSRRRRKSHSPEYSLRTSTAKANPSGTPIPLPPASATISLKRKKSPGTSGGGGLSTIGAERMPVDCGPRLREKSTIDSTASSPLSSPAPLPSDHLRNSESTSTFPQYRPKKDKGKKADRCPHNPPPRVLHNDATKHQDSVENHTYSGPLAIAEFERMKKEIENLKKAVHDSKKTVKKQKKKIDNLSNEISAVILTKKEQESQLQSLDLKCQKNEELIATIETSLQCQICMDLLHKPYALASCGHILCLPCLQEWFRKAPPSSDDMDDIDLEDPDNDPHYILTRTKSCPCCRAVVTRRPVPVFIVKAMASALLKAKLSEANTSGVSGRVSTPDGDGDVWKGLFPSEEDEDREEDEDDYDPYHDDVDWAFHSGLAHFRTYGFDSESGSGSGDDDDADEVGGDESGDEDDLSGVYVATRWEPPRIIVDPTDYDLEDCAEDRSILAALRRGCTYGMVQVYDMEYTHEEGLVAHLYSLDHLYCDDGIDIRGGGVNRVFLGWSIEVADADFAGEVFMQRTLEDMAEFPERWQITERLDVDGAYDAKRLVKLEDVEDYDTTDSEGWLGEDELY